MRKRERECVFTAAAFAKVSVYVNDLCGHIMHVCTVFCISYCSINVACVCCDVIELYQFVLLFAQCT